MTDSLLRFEIGETYHKHDFDGPLIKGEFCNECSPAEPALVITDIDRKNGIITISSLKPKLWTLGEDEVE